MENETILTEEIYKKFLRQQTKNSMIIIRVCYCIILFSAIVMLVTNILFPLEADWIFFVFDLVMGSIFVLYDIFFVPLNIKATKTKNIIDCKYKFYFDETKFSLTVTKGEKLILESALSYDLIYKVVFYQNYIYIYLNRMNAYVVAKEGFKNEEDYQHIVDALKPFENNKSIKNKF